MGSHYHFFEVNRALRFDRDASFGMHLDIPAGTAVRFEPGEEREVGLVAFGGRPRAIRPQPADRRGQTSARRLRARASSGFEGA